MAKRASHQRRACPPRSARSFGRTGRARRSSRALCLQEIQKATQPRNELRSEQPEHPACFSPTPTGSIARAASRARQAKPVTADARSPPVVVEYWEANTFVVDRWEGDRLAVDDRASAFKKPTCFAQKHTDSNVYRMAWRPRPIPLKAGYLNCVPTCSSSTAG